MPKTNRLGQNVDGDPNPGFPVPDYLTISEIRHSLSIDIFDRDLKTFLFAHY